MAESVMAISDSGKISSREQCLSFVEYIQDLKNLLELYIFYAAMVVRHTSNCSCILQSFIEKTVEESYSLKDSEILFRKVRYCSLLTSGNEKKTQVQGN